MRKILTACLIALAIFVIFLPQILSTSIGKPFFERALGKKFDLSLTIGSLHLSWFGPQSFQKVQFSNSDMKGSIESLESNVPFWSLSQFGNAFSLKNGFFSFPKYGDLSIGPVEALIAGHDVKASGIASQGGRFNLNGKIYSKTDFDLVAEFSQMPTTPFDPLLKTNGFFSATLGATFNLNTTIVYNQGEGHIAGELSSPNARALLDAQIAQDSLLLKRPLDLTLHLSPELGLKLGGQIIEAKNPITLRVDTAGTTIPIAPFALERLEIGHATLNLGQLVCRELHPLITLFALLNRGSLASSTAVIWFTPIDFSIDTGLFRMGRIDALIAYAIHLAAWGNIDLLTSKLDMRLGIPADTLALTLGIQSLSRNSVLQIPVHGTIQNPDCDTGSAAAKIAALVAGKQILNKLSKKTGPLGGLLNQVSPSLGDDETAPPPKRPFPWEQG